MTLRSIERGGGGVTIAAYLAVMHVLGLERDLDLLAKEDAVGRELQDAALPRRRGGRGAARPRQASPTRPMPAPVPAASAPAIITNEVIEHGADLTETITSDDLAAMIAPPPHRTV